MELLEERFHERLSHLWLDAGYNAVRARGGIGLREGVGPDGGGRTAPESVGVGARRPRAAAVAGFYGLAEEMGSRANVLVDRPEPQAEQGLREALPATSEAFVYVGL